MINHHAYGTLTYPWSSNPILQFFMEIWNMLNILSFQMLMKTTWWNMHIVKYGVYL